MQYIVETTRYHDNCENYRRALEIIAGGSTMTREDMQNIAQSTIEKADRPAPRRINVIDRITGEEWREIAERE